MCIRDRALKSAAGYIRRELGARLTIRHTPQLLFYATDSIEYSANISRILHGLDLDDDADTDEEQEDTQL